MLIVLLVNYIWIRNQQHTQKKQSNHTEKKKWNKSHLGMEIHRKGAEAYRRNFCVRRQIICWVFYIEGLIFL